MAEEVRLSTSEDPSPTLMITDVLDLAPEVEVVESAEVERGGRFKLNS